MKNFIKTMVLAGLTLFVGTTATAQNCNNKNAQSFAVKTVNGSECIQVNYNESEGNFDMSMNFPREKTDEIKSYLITELGQKYTTHTGGLQRWTNLKNEKTEGFKVSLSNGYIRISYVGDDEDIKEEIKALAREVKYKMSEEVK